MTELFNFCFCLLCHSSPRNYCFVLDCLDCLEVNFLSHRCPEPGLFVHLHLGLVFCGTELRVDVGLQVAWGCFVLQIFFELVHAESGKHGFIQA